MPGSGASPYTEAEDGARCFDRPDLCRDGTDWTAMMGPEVTGVTKGVLVALEDLDLFEAVEDSEAEVLKRLPFLRRISRSGCYICTTHSGEKTHVRSKKHTLKTCETRKITLISRITLIPNR